MSMQDELMAHANLLLSLDEDKFNSVLEEAIEYATSSDDTSDFDICVMGGVRGFLRVPFVVAGTTSALNIPGQVKVPTLVHSRSTIPSSQLEGYISPAPPEPFREYAIREDKISMILDEAA